MSNLNYKQDFSVQDYLETEIESPVKREFINGEVFAMAGASSNLPARAGSKRLANKNIQNIQGKPLIAWTIEAGLKSSYIDEVMVTTDSEKIIKISKTYGAIVPFKRPDKLSNDLALRPDIIKHTIDFYSQKLKKQFDYLIFLQPTLPLRTEVDIDSAIEYLFEKNADAIVSVCELEHPINWTGSLPESNDMINFLNDVAVKSRSQDLDINYRLNGAIYICNIKKFLEQGCIFLDDNIYAYKMDKKRSIDIDDEFDFKIAEFFLTLPKPSK